MPNELTVLKLGGSVITHKKRGGGVRRAVIRRVAKEIYAAIHARPQRLILVHGAGGKAHHLARSFELQAGAQTQEKIFGAFKTHETVASLQRQVAAIFWRERLVVFPIQTSAVFSRQGTKILFSNSSLIREVLSRGFIPLLHGDMVFDSEKNFSILSGDTVAVMCANKFGADQVLFATDVDGIYTDDPQKNRKATLLKTVSAALLRQLTQNQRGSTRDATGQMPGKLSNILHSEFRGTVRIFNGLRSGNVKRVILGQRLGTIVRRIQKARS